jgi:hypothetical protein
MECLLKPDSLLPSIRTSWPNLRGAHGLGHSVENDDALTAATSGERFLGRADTLLFNSDDYETPLVKWIDSLVSAVHATPNG